MAVFYYGSTTLMQCLKINLGSTLKYRFLFAAIKVLPNYRNVSKCRCLIQEMSRNVTKCRCLFQEMSRNVTKCNDMKMPKLWYATDYYNM